MNLPAVWLMRRPEAAPTDSAGLSREVLERAFSFQSERRRSDFLWARRLLAFALASVDPHARLVERPPLTPAVESELSLCASISHTDHWIGVALSHEPVALDLEVIKPARVRRELFVRVFGDELWETAESSDPVNYFYRAWGVYECSVKLQADFVRTPRSYHINLTGQAARVDHFVLPRDTMLTVAGSSDAAPDLMRVDRVHDSLSCQPFGLEATALFP